MSVTVICSECKAEYVVAASKAGKTVPCPECDAENRPPRGNSGRSGRHLRPGEAAVRRPGESSGATTTKVALIGATILVLGVLAMVGFKVMRASAIQNFDDNVELVNKGEDDALGPNTTIGPVGDTTTTTVGSPPAQTFDGATGTPVTPVTSTNLSDDSVIDVTHSDRGREIMAKMNDVSIERAQFSRDARGDIGNAIETGIRAELQKCKLTYRAGSAEPEMKVKLNVRQTNGQQKLWMSAELLAKEDDKTVRVWERKGSVANIDDKALNSGVVPNIDRDVSRFFNSLRSDFIEARRQFTS